MGYIKKIIRKLMKPRELMFSICHRTGIVNLWSDEKYIRMHYRVRLGRELNLDNPCRFTEKMQWLKLYDRKDEYTTMVDKFEVKKYVSEKIGEKYVIPCLGVWERFEDINFSILPNQFVLKTTHDSGGVAICKDKNNFDIEKAEKVLSENLKRNFYLLGREWPYKNVRPRIIAEQYFENDSKEGLHDYKVWCFNGKARYIQYITGRISEKTYEGFYDRDWNLQDFAYLNPLMDNSVEKPDKLEELLYVAEILAEGIPFARIDFYILPGGSIKFGEITFFPLNGTEPWNPDTQDEIMGRMLKLPHKSI